VLLIYACVSIQATSFYRRIYHITNYFFFLANIATGLFSCLLRILLGTAGGFLSLGRLDRSVLMKGLENFDSGKQTLAVISLTLIALLATYFGGRRRFIQDEN